MEAPKQILQEVKEEGASTTTKYLDLLPANEVGNIGTVSQDLVLLNQVYKDANVKSVTGNDFIEKLKTRVIKHNKNLIIAIVGETGSGKSYASLKLAEALSGGPGTFPLENVAFSGAQFTELVNKNLPRGSVIVFEEVGYNYSNRKWQKNFGKNAILQTFRHQNLILIMNTPSQSFMDKQARQLTHAVFRMMRINNKFNYSVMAPYFQENNPINEKFSRFGFTGLSGDFISEIRLSLPSVKLRNAYEKTKTEFTDKLNKKFLKQYTEEESEENIEKEVEERIKESTQEFSDETALFTKSRRQRLLKFRKMQEAESEGE